MQASPLRPQAKSPGIFPRGGKFCPRQGRKPFDLKVALIYRPYAPLNRTHTERRVLHPQRLSSLGQAFLKACGFQRQSLWSPSAEGESPFTAFSFCLAFSFVPAKGKRKSAKRFLMANGLFACTKILCRGLFQPATQLRKCLPPGGSLLSAQIDSLFYRAFDLQKKHYFRVKVSPSGI